MITMDFTRTQLNGTGRMRQKKLSPGAQT
jgi:hypothetical protein